MDYEIIEHALKLDQHGIAGYIAYPRRTSPGPRCFSCISTRVSLAT